jgi:4-hydroxy-tetrahydrodipicolinate synthase
MSGHDRARGFADRLRGGLIPAVPVPFGADGGIAWAAHERYVARVAGERVRGVALWAHTGRGLLLEPDQRRDVLRAWRRGFGGPIIAGVGARPTGADAAAFDRFAADTLRMAELALDNDADALMAYAPVAYRDLPPAERDRRIVEHHRALAELGAPLVLFYLYEAAGGITYTLDVLGELFSLPNVVGIKMATLDSVMTFQDVAALIRERFSDTLLITGEDRFLGYSLLCGAQAALIGMGAACIGPQIALLDAYMAQDWGRFLALSEQIDRFSQAVFVAPMEGYIRRVLWALADEGTISEAAVHDPFGPPLDAGERERVRRAVQELGLSTYIPGLARVP